MLLRWRHVIPFYMHLAKRAAYAGINKKLCASGKCYLKLEHVHCDVRKRTRNWVQICVWVAELANSVLNFGSQSGLSLTHSTHSHRILMCNLRHCPSAAWIAHCSEVACFEQRRHTRHSKAAVLFLAEVFRRGSYRTGTVLCFSEVGLPWPPTAPRLKPYDRFRRGLLEGHALKQSAHDPEKLLCGHKLSAVLGQPR
jgi:hypothetical protein